MRGKPRYVQWRTPQCWFLPGDPGLPNRDALSAAPTTVAFTAMRSEDRRARVEGLSEGCVPSCREC